MRRTTAIMALALAGGCGLVGYGDGGDDTTAACYQTVALGGDHTCALNRAGKVYCWGADDHGQVSGGAGGAARPLPVAVTLPASAVELAAGPGTSCAITDAHELWCWGARNGVLVSDYGAPTRLDLGAEVYRVGLGERFGCAKVAPDDHVACWGLGDGRRLGQDDDTAHPTPIAVPGPVGLAALWVGARDACALEGDGTVWCWGDNRSGQLGLGLEDVAAGPHEVAALAGVDRIAIGERVVCASDGSGVRCWGANDLGQLGEGTIGGVRAVPGAPLTGPVQQVVAMANAACTLDWDGAVRCWGQNRAGQLGTGDLAVRSAPVELQAMHGARALFAGAQQACAEKDGALWCWGDNLDGQLGRGSVGRSSTPRPVGAGTAFASVDGNAGTLCAVDRNDQLWCWGDGERYQTGLGVQAGADTPRMVLAGVKQVAVGGVESCARKDAGVWCWGRGATTPREFTSDTAVWIDAGDDHACELLATELRCWGDNARGQVGDGTRQPQPAPVKIHLGDAPAAVVLGSAHTCALDVALGLWCWGAGTEGQLGNGAITDEDHPVPIAHPVAGRTFRKLAAGRAHTCAIDDANDLYCWGGNGQGQLGSLPGPSLVPRKVDWPAAAGAVREVFIRFDTTCAILMDGTARCWGDDGHGALAGSGAIPRPFGDVAGIARFGGGELTLCAVTGTGELFCAGAGQRGQLGSDFLGWTPAKLDVPCD